jgi:hypothetical protein
VSRVRQALRWYFSEEIQYGWRFIAAMWGGATVLVVVLQLVDASVLLMVATFLTWWGLAPMIWRRL